MRVVWLLKILSSGMCKKEKSLYGTIKFGKVKVLNILRRALTFEADETNIISKEKIKRLNCQIL